MKTGKVAFVFSTVMLVLMLIGAALTPIVPAAMLAGLDTAQDFEGVGIAHGAVIMGVNIGISTAIIGIIGIVFSAFSISRSSGRNRCLSVVWLIVDVLVLASLIVVFVLLQ